MSSSSGRVRTNLSSAHVAEKEGYKVELSVIIPLYGFQPQREEALRKLLAAIEAQDLRVCDAQNNPTEEKNFEVIVVEQAAVKNCFHMLENKPWLRHITLPDQEKGFNKSWCMNVAAKASRCPWLVFLDVDMIFDKNFFGKINYFRQDNPTYFTCWQYIVSLPGKDMPIAKIIDPGIMTAGGAFFIDKPVFWQVGGMNENYYGYGGEDNDFWVRINLHLGDKGKNNIKHMPYALGHWYHDWAEPSPERFYHLNRTIQHPDKVTSRLKRLALGNVNGPTPLDVSDLTLKEDGIESKAGKGIL
jgi:glycosyltransferase involved in cell wall biosynthesis